MPVQRSKASCVLAAFALIAACGHKTDVVTRTVTAHAPVACGDASPAGYGYFLASGDFDPSVGVQRSLAEIGAELPGVPETTRSLVADVSFGDNDWRGVADVAPKGDVDVLLWPFQSACALSQDIDRASGIALAMFAPQRALVVGGVAITSPHAWVVDLSTGTLTPTQAGLRTGRYGATVTPFGDGALVAGGFASQDVQPLHDAEIFVGTLHGTGDFDHSTTIPLSGARFDHGAVQLAKGETLLVGGHGTNETPLRSFEIVDPVTRSNNVQGLAALEVGRWRPKVLRLANGEIFVGGGTDGSNDVPITKLEWFTADASHAARKARDLVARKTRDFVALPGGGVLAVIAPLPTDTDFPSVWVISADGDPEPAVPVGGVLTDVLLFPGTEGRPILWTGDRWLRWSPWEGRFVGTDITVPDCTAMPRPAACPIPHSPAVSPDPGLALFLGGDASTPNKVSGLRFGARSEYGSLVQPLLVADVSGLAPDRLVLPGTTNAFSFDAQSGLSLSTGATAVVTDLTYAGFVLDADTPTGAPPLVVLRDDRSEIELGNLACTFGQETSLHIERSGATIRANGRDCAVAVRPDARLSIGFRGGTAEKSVVRNVRIVRR